MKGFLTITCLFVAMGAFGAFSSAKWLAQRDDDSDVLRLRDAYADCVKKLEAPAEDVVIPLEYFPDGTVKSRVKAARAQIFTDTDLVWGKNVHVEQYEADGSLKATLDAENCVVDRRTRAGWVEGSAKMVYGKSSVKGRGIYFSLAREYIKIFSQSEIRTSQAGLNPGSLFK